MNLIANLLLVSVCVFSLCDAIFWNDEPINIEIEEKYPVHIYKKYPVKVPVKVPVYIKPSKEYKKGYESKGYGGGGKGYEEEHESEGYGGGYENEGDEDMKYDNYGKGGGGGYGSYKK